MRRALLFLLPLVPLCAESVAPPKTRAGNHVDTIHGVKVPDPYRWLEDQSRPETRAWIARQNDYTRSILDKIPSRERIAARISELLHIETAGVPIVRGGRYFFVKRLPDQSQANLYVRRSADGQDQVLVDANALSPDHTKSVRLIEVSPDGRRLAYGIQTGGEDEIDLHSMDVDSQKDAVEGFPKARYWSMVFRNDGTGVYYTRITDGGPRLLYHAFGTPVADDPVVFGADAGAEQFITVTTSPGSRYLAIRNDLGNAAEQVRVFIKEIDSDAPPVPVVTDIEAIFGPAIAGGRLYLFTNWKAPNGRVLSAEVKEPGRGHWQEIIPEGTNAIDTFTAVKDRVLVNYVDAAVSRPEIYDHAGKRIAQVELPVKGTATDFLLSDTGEAYFAFTSFAVAGTIFKCDLDSGRLDPWYGFKVPVETDNIEVSQVRYPSKDGTRIPMFLVHSKGLDLDENRPVLLTGYGGFRVNITPAFSALAIAFIEHGGVFAVANLRGGCEFGESWHKAGMLGHKQNVFDDFIAAAEWLVANKYTKPSRIAIRGGSNGGLLVGAVTVERPDLFHAVICGAPLLDMIRYHKFLVARWWVPEYGSSDDPEQFR